MKRCANCGLPAEKGRPLFKQKALCEIERYVQHTRGPIYLHDDESICLNMLKEAVAKAREAGRIKGIRLAASVASDYDRTNSHPYLVSDCILGKLNVLKRKPRRNTKCLVVARAALHRVGRFRPPDGGEALPEHPVRPAPAAQNAPQRSIWRDAIHGRGHI